VWEALREKAGRHDVESPTGAQADLSHALEDGLAALRGAFPLLPGQSGALFALGGESLCLDYVSRAGVRPPLREAARRLRAGRERALPICFR